MLEDEHRNMWPQAIDGVLFVHRTAKHNSTGYSPYRIVYGRDPVMPIDVKYDTSKAPTVGDELDEEYVKHVV